MDGAKGRRKGENSLIVSPTFSLDTEEKLSIDPVSEMVSEIDRGTLSSPASVLPRVNWRNTYRDKKLNVNLCLLQM